MHTKRIAKGYGKKPKWIVTPQGPHAKEDSLSLLLIVRDILGYADTAREAKFIINQGEVRVDKVVRKNYRYGAGLMDVIEIPQAKKYFRVLPSKKGMELREIKKKESNFKLVKVMDKKILGKDKIQINLHDGGNILVKEEEGKKINPKDSLVLELPKRKIQKKIEFGKGNLAIIAKGRHSGEVGKVEEILPGTQTRRSLTRIGEIQTLSDYVFMIGKKSSLIST